MAFHVVTVFRNHTHIHKPVKGLPPVNWKLSPLYLIVETSQFSKVLSNFLVVRNTMKSHEFPLTPQPLQETPMPRWNTQKASWITKEEKREAEIQHLVFPTPISHTSMPP